MKTLLLASVAVILSAATAHSQSPPAPPVIIGIAPGTRADTEQIVVTGMVEKTADGRLLVRTGAREYELPPAQYSMLRPHLEKQVQVVGTELHGESGRRLLVIDHIIISTARETPRR